MATNIELSYLAGVIDSDGSITIVIHKRSAHSRTHSIILQISQCDRQAVQLAYKLFGGYFYIRKSRSNRRRSIIAWRTTDKGAVPALQALSPFLRIKKKQATIALRLAALKARKNKTERRVGFAPQARFLKPAIRRQMDRLLIEIRSLNHPTRPARNAFVNL